MKMLKNQRFQKLFIFLAGIFSLGLFSTFVSAQISIPLSFDNAIEYIKRIIITDSGGNSGNVLLDVDGSSKTIRINTGYIADGSSWNNKVLGLSGNGQLIYINQNTGSIATGEYYPLTGNSITNPITGALFIGDSTGSYNVEIGTTMLDFGVMTPVYGPIITPNAYVPGLGPILAMITKGINFFLGEEENDTHMFLSSFDGTFATKFSSHGDEPVFEISLYSGNLTDDIVKRRFNDDGRIQVNNDISSFINDDNDFITKKYLDYNFYPLIGNSITNPITGPLYMEDGNSNLTIGIETGTIIFSNTTLLYTGPVITPMSELQGIGLFPTIGIKGMPMLQGLPGQTTLMYFVNSTGDRGAGFELDELGNRFDISLSSGGLDQQIAKWSFREDGRIEAGTDLSSIINSDNDFITKKYADQNFFPGTSINPTITGQDFRFARSGGLMEAQYFTGGAWTTATIFTLP